MAISVDNRNLPKPKSGMRCRQSRNEIERASNLPRLQLEADFVRR